jgi:fatty acid desaturase
MRNRAHQSLLRHRADWRTLTLLAALTLLFAWRLAGAGAWLLLPCSLLTFTACVAKHNHTHCTTFSKRWANRALNVWLTLLTGSSTSGIRVAHQRRHHGGNQSPEDFVRSSLVAGQPAMLALLNYVPLVVRESWRGMRKDFRAERRRSLGKEVLLERVLLWIFIGAGMAVAPWEFLATFPLPWLFGQWFLVAINLPQHDGCDETSRWAHSRNVVSSVANWLFLNNGYHTAHHERPGLHWSLLRKFHDEHVRPQLPPELASSSLWALWSSWWVHRTRRTQKAE